jgi:hypothetical protein
MSLYGKRDEDAERMRLEKIKQQELQESAGKRGRPRKDFTEVIQDRAADRIPYLTDKALDAIENALKSGNEKVALDAANKYLKIFHQPTQKVDVSGMDKQEVHLHLQQSQNLLREEDQKLLGEFLDLIKDAAENETIDVDATDVDVIEDQSEGE